MEDTPDITVTPVDPTVGAPIELALDAASALPTVRHARRGLIAGLGVAALIVAVAAVLLVTRGGDGDEQSVLGRAASATEAQRTARIDMTMRMPTGATGQMTSVIDFEARRMRSVMDISSLPGVSSSGSGAAGGKIDLLSSGLVAYMKGPALGDIPGGKWLKIDYGILFAAQGLDPVALTSQKGNDATAMLDMLRKAGEVTVVGPEDVRGAATTHYRSTLEPSAVFATSGAVADQAKVDQMVALFTGPMVVDAWLGADKLIRRYAITMTTTAGTTSYQYELYDFGVAVDVKLPAERDVIDISEMIGR